jgi:putative flavoprotein involved in K+ transport
MGAAERFDTVIVGGGQAGLTVGYYLRKQGRSFVILDAGERVGDAWRRRWDSLRLFTAAQYDGLPGWPFPAPAWTFPTKDEMADYLEAYAARFDIPVRNGVAVDGLARDGDRFLISAGEHRFDAGRVVVASGACQIPNVPAFASELDPGIVQLRSKEYLRPSQLRDGDVLLVGAGNSGAEISFELSKTHTTLLSGPDTGHIPVRHGNQLSARLVFPVVRFVGQHVLTKRTPIGRKIGSKFLSHGDPLIRVQPVNIAAAGIQRVPSVVGVRGGMPLLDDGRVLDVANVIWCTGFRQDFSWIHLPVFDDDGRPIHTRGVVDAEPGLYFVGLPFLFSVTSDVLPSRGRDAAYIAKHIASRSRGLATAREAMANEG